MNREQYVQRVLEIDAEKPVYRLGGDGSDGTCDCVGLGIGAMRRGGIKYDGLHGSNWAARYEAVELWEIESVSELSVGDNTLKAYEPGDPKWALPERYSDDPDQRDYYHFGVVTSVNPLRITHCTSPTTKTDTTLGKWKYAFRWRQLSETEEPAMYKGEVKLDESRYLNLRNGPGTNYRVIGSIPNGSTIEVLTESGDWLFVRFGAKSGYVIGNKVVRAEEEPEETLPPTTEEQKHVTTIARDDGVTITLEGNWRVAND